jgi:putative ABC transport system substrate-binding protein
LEVHLAGDIVSSFEGLKDRADALYVVIDPLVGANSDVINSLALRARLPTIQGTRDYLAGGGLVSYGTNIAESFRRVADLTDRILRGAKPADIPVEQPTKFDLVINLKTAKVLGLSIPPMLLARADEVIE